MKSRHLLILSLSLVGLVYAGCKTASLKKSNESFGLAEYAKASDMYKQVYKNNKTTKEEKQKAAFQAAEGYRLNHDPDNAEKWYSTAQRRGVKDPILLFRMGEAQMKQGKYTEAMENLRNYKKQVPEDTRADLMLQGCEMALEDKNRKTRVNIEFFKPTNESKTDDFSPMWADRKHSALMFTTDREEGANKKTYNWTGRMHTDVWVMEKKGKKGKEKWMPPTLVEGLNSEFNDGVVTFDGRYSTMYFTMCNGKDGKEKTCKIYEARKKGGAWDVNPQPLPFSSDSFNCGHPSLTEDGNRLYFASDMPGGYGNPGEDVEKTKDLYVVNFVRRGRTWSDPVNLGPTINTRGNEVFPYIHEDGTLYFSSDGHPGFGGLDIFSTTGSGQEWEAPKNLLGPFNSHHDDFGIIIESDKMSGYFSSNRLKGDDDIYYFYIEPMFFRLTGQVTNCDNGTALANSLVVISNDKDSSKIRLYTDSKGYYQTDLQEGTNYEIFAQKRDEYFYDSKPKYVSTVGLEQSTNFVKDFCLKNQCNDIFVLPIYYGLDSSNLRSESRRVLDDLIGTLKKYPKMKVELGSHTDCRSSFEYNRALSQRRADSAVAYIIENGINPFRLEARGYGESQLVNQCECEGAKVVPCKEDEHQLNRRTTVKVVNCNFVFDTEAMNAINRNDSALEGKGSIFSPFLLQKQKEHLAQNKGNIDSLIRVREEEERRKQAEKELQELLAKYDVLPISKSREGYFVNATIGRKRLKMIYDEETSKTQLTQKDVEALIQAKSLSISDFEEGKEKLKLSDGTKITSRNFKIKELQIGDMTFKDVKCRMVDDKKPMILGTSLFNKYLSVTIKDDKLLLEKEPAEEQ